MGSQMWVERIGQSSRTPWQLTFDPDVLIILGSTLSAVWPQEGCALLLGERNDAGWHLRSVWPCCNVWQPDLARFRNDASGEARPANSPSRRSRFVIDPREQLHAQRWARTRALAVIGSAHSHPQGESIPSIWDRRWLGAPGLMLIQGADHSLRAWWLEPEAIPCFGAVQHTDG